MLALPFQTNPGAGGTMVKPGGLHAAQSSGATMSDSLDSLNSS